MKVVPALPLILIGLLASLSSLLEQTHLALTRKDYARATRLAQAIIIERPDEPRGWFYLGTAQLNDGRAKEAKRSFARAVQLAPDQAPMWFNLGTAAFESKLFGEAEQAFLAVVPLDTELAPLALVNAGFAAFAEGRTHTAESHLRDALKIAPPRDAVVQAKVDVLLQAIEDRREERTRIGIRRLVREGTQALEAGKRDLASKRLREALALAQASQTGAEAASEIEDVLADVKADEAPPPQSRFAVEANLSVGYDSNVPQSGVLVTQPSTADAASPGAAVLSATLDVLWRPVGESRNGLSIVYAFSQTAYLSKLLDPFSLQEHILRADGIWSPHERVSLEVQGEGFLVMSGVQTYGLLLAGAMVGPRITIREPQGLSSKLEYDHSFKFALNPDYKFLSGDRDAVSFVQSIGGEKWQLAAGYLFRHEAVGIEQLPIDFLFVKDFTNVFGSGAEYTIPYGYNAHEVTLEVTLHLPASFRVGVTGGYEHRNYLHPSYITSTLDGGAYYHRDRVDDRYTFGLEVERDFGHGFSLELDYTMLASTSTIDNSNPLTSLDYANENFFKHVIELAVAYSY